MVADLRYTALKFGTFLIKENNIKSLMKVIFVLKIKSFLIKYLEG